MNVETLCFEVTTLRGVIDVKLKSMSNVRFEKHATRQAMDRCVPFLFHNEVLLPVTSLQYPSIRSARLSAWSKLEQVMLSVSAAPATLSLIHAFACSLQSETSVWIDCI